jgi:hypothetical protein
LLLFLWSLLIVWYSCFLYKALKQFYTRIVQAKLQYHPTLLLLIFNVNAFVSCLFIYSSSYFIGKVLNNVYVRNQNPRELPSQFPLTLPNRHILHPESHMNIMKVQNNTASPNDCKWQMIRKANTANMYREKVMSAAQKPLCITTYLPCIAML